MRINWRTAPRTNNFAESNAQATRRRRLAAALGSLCIVSCTPDEPPTSASIVPTLATPWFEEVSREVKVEFTRIPYLKQRYYFPEVVSGGVGLFDYDNDGDLDIYFVQGGDLVTAKADNPGNKLFRNRGDGTFEDVTESARVGDRGYGMGCACGDFDRDGDIDLYVTNVGPNVLYANNGDGTFTDITESAGVGDPSWGSSTTFVDCDGDGFLDIFVANFVVWSPARELKCGPDADHQDYCSPKNYQTPAPDVLYHNNGDGTFTDVSEAAGLRADFGNGLGVVSGDFNRDGLTDLYVANDGMPNQLWINTGNGKFRNDALLSGCALNGVGAAEASMGIIAIDIENDGDLDFFLSHLRNESNTFYRNDGGLFEDVTARLGLSAPSLPYTGFGLGIVDFDHDGHLDIYIANGRVTRQDTSHDPADPYAEPNQLFRGAEGGRFEGLVPNGGTATSLIKNSRGAAFGDIDNDGDMDVVIVNVAAQVHVLRNIAGSRGSSIMFRVLNQYGGDAIGASVKITTGTRHQWRTVQISYSYCASNDPRVHFGLGDATTIDDVTVRWSFDRTESFGPFVAGKTYELVQGRGKHP